MILYPVRNSQQVDFLESDLEKDREISPFIKIYKTQSTPKVDTTQDESIEGLRDKLEGFMSRNRFYSE